MSKGGHNHKWLPIPAILLALLLLAVYSQAQPERVQLRFDPRADVDTALESAHMTSLAGNYDRALVIYRSTFEESQFIRYKYGIVRSLLGLGVSEVNLGRNEPALAFFEHALRYCDTSDETGGLIATIYNNMSNIYYLRGDHAQAVKLLEKAVLLRERIPSKISLSSIYINLSNVLSSMGRLDLAALYLNKAEAEAEKTDDPVVRANVLHSKGSYYIHIKEWPRAKSYFEQAVAVGRQHGYDDIWYSAMINLADIALGQHDPQQAIRYIQEAESTFNNAAPFYRGGALMILGKAQLKLKHYESAEQSLKKALLVSEGAEAKENILEVYRLLHLLYSERRDYARAHTALMQEKKLSDSLNSKHNTEAVTRIEARYRSAQKDKDIAEKQLLITKQRNDINARNVWVGLAIGGLVILGVVIFFLRNSYRQRQQLGQERLHHLMREQELNKMKAIMEAEEKERSRIARDLHDGIMIQFSTVKMNLSALTGGPDPDVKKQQLRPYILQLDKATQSLRKAAHHLMPDMLLEEGLAEAVHYFLNSLRPDVAFEISYEPLDPVPRFDIQLELAIYRIIQELIQNIIKHAAASEVYIQLSYSNHQLGIDIEDNGMGIEASSKQGHQGTGLRSIESRVPAMNGSMQMKSSSQGTSISLEFNLDIHP